MSRKSARVAAKPKVQKEPEEEFSDEEVEEKPKKKATPKTSGIQSDSFLLHPIHSFITHPYHSFITLIHSLS
jgi:hypothetical protein